MQAANSAVFSLGGDLPIRRLGFGAMRITGPGIWGSPPDEDAAIRLLRRVAESGITLIDTADSYGPGVSETLIARALHPYSNGLVIATKGGLVRPAPDRWVADCRPEHLRHVCEESLTRLRLERIDLYQLHAVDPRVPIEDSIGALLDLQRAGKIRHIGVSNVSADQLARARRVAAIVSVQNHYNWADRSSDPIVDVCACDGLAFIPWYPLAAGRLAQRGSALADIAQRRRTTPSQIALAWLLRRSPAIIPIPGTSAIVHFEENLRAAEIELSEAEMHALSGGAA
ncbi:MAG: aldo/keto reductase [Alphaproteobacteria bacterium]|nr:aldo/keto reductase [Alphaproteobacteria bacterium]